jgi:hypothetical protein
VLATNEKFLQTIKKEFKKKVKDTMRPNEFILGKENAEKYEQETLNYEVGKKCL